MDHHPTNANATLDPRSIAYTDLLFDCIQQRLEIARHIKELNQAQVKAAESGQPDAMLSVLARKQTLLDNLLSIQEVLRPYQSDRPDDRLWASQSKRQQCRQLVEESSRLLAESLEQEEALLVEVTAQREAVAEQLREGSDAMSARNAYKSNNTLHRHVLDIGGV